MKMERKILDLFLYNNKLKFSEIEKLVKIRSNKLAYQLKILIKKGILQKQDESYLLSDASEYLIPYLSEKKAILPVVLIFIGNKNKCFLFKRQKRPYKNYLSLPGGRIFIGENINNACERLMKEKFNVKTKFKKINSISLEHVKKKNKIIHSFLLIFVTARTREDISYIDINKNKKNIIKSDYYLIKNKINGKVDVGKINSILT